MKSLLYLIAAAISGMFVHTTRPAKPVTHHMKMTGITMHQEQKTNKDNIVVLPPASPVPQSVAVNAGAPPVVTDNGSEFHAQALPPATPVKKEKAHEVKPSHVSSSATVYSIQLLAVAFPHSVHSPIFKGRKVKQALSDADHLYRYTTGNFKSLHKALKEVNRLRTNFPGAFVIATANGKRVPVLKNEIAGKR